MKSMIAFTFISISTVSLLANAASSLKCKQAAEDAVQEREDNEADITGIQSNDGINYVVTYIQSGDESGTRVKALVKVDPSSCDVKSVRVP